jgi:flagellar hook-associated protein 3 FlgL
MPVTSVGDLAQSQFLRRQTANVKSEVDRLTTEIATGRVADSSAHLRGDQTALAGIDSVLARLRGHASVTAALTLQAEAQQRALARVEEVASGAATTLVTAAYGTQSGLRDAGRQAWQALDTTLQSLNLRLGDRAVFAGDRAVFAGDGGDGTAIPGAAELMARLQAAVAPAADGPSVAAAVEAWFAAPDGFPALYRGGPPAPALAISPNEAVALDITAADPVLRDTIKALALGALLSDPGVGGGNAGRAALARQAGEALAGQATDRATLAGRLGVVQQRLAEAESRNSAEADAMAMARNSLLEADPYDTATRLQDAEARLEMLYTLTARLSRLSLVDFL